MVTGNGGYIGESSSYSHPGDCVKSGKWCVVVLYPTEYHDFNDKDAAFAFVVRMERQGRKASAFEVTESAGYND